MSFESKLSKGNFCIPICNNCEKTIWPPAEFCNICNQKISLKEEEFEGKIIEFSKQNEDYFCIVEFEESIRIMAKMTNNPKIGQKVKITKCGIKDNNYYFYVS